MNGYFRLGEKARRGMQEIADRLDIDMTVAGYGSVFVPYFMSGTITRYADLLRNNTEADTCSAAKWSSEASSCCRWR